MKELTEQEIRNMKPVELHAAVNEHVMGWKNPWQPFFPSTDISAAYEMESKIAENDELRGRYVVALMHIVEIEYGTPPEPNDIFSLIHASAADRCRAALLAIGGAER